MNGFKIITILHSFAIYIPSSINIANWLYEINFMIFKSSVYK